MKYRKLHAYARARSVLLVVSILTLLGSVITTEASTNHSLIMESQLTTCSQVTLKNGTAGVSTISMNNTIANVSVAAPLWLSGWAKRAKITINSMDIDEALADFPLLVYLSSSSGENNDDVTSVFDEVGSDYNATAFTGSDGTSRLYFEVEYWNTTSEEAWMWVRVPSISNTTDTEIYIYFDSSNDGSAYNSPTNVWDSNYVMVQHLEETSGAHYDSTSNNNDGTQGGGVTQDATGKIDGADEFDGTNDYVDCGNIGTLNSPFTVEAWAYFNNLNQPNGDYDYILMIGTGANMISFSRHGVGADADKFYSYSESSVKLGPVLSGQQWLHIVGVYNTSGPFHQLYINGQSVSVDDFSAAMNTNGHVTFGKYEPTGSHYLDGTTDEVRISNITRSTSWINTTYQNVANLANFLSIGNEETGGAVNYELDLEIQWTNANYTRSNEELCIKTGNGNWGAEDIEVYVWNITDSSWDLVLNDLNANSWNNVSVTSYLTSSTFTVRFLGGNESSDTSQDSWDIDVTQLHVWPSIETTYDYVLRVNNTVTDSWQIRLKKYADSTISRLQNCTISFRNSTDGVSGQIQIENGNYTLSGDEGSWYDLHDSETIYIAMTVEANATGTSYVYTYLEIRISGTTMYLQHRIEFEIT